MQSLENATVSDAIGLIYDCALAPERWRDLVQRICERLDFVHGVLGLFVTATGHPVIRIQHGMPAQWYDAMPTYATDAIEFWGGLDRLQALPLGRVEIHSVVQPDVPIGKNRFADEWCAPQGILDMAGIMVARDADFSGSLVFCSQRLIRDDSCDGPALLRLLSPHICRAVAIGRLFDFRTIQLQDLFLAIDCLQTGVILLDAAGTVFHANKAALAIVEQAQHARIKDGRLVLADGRGAAGLANALTTMRADRAGFGRGEYITAGCRQGHKLVISVLPVARAFEGQMPGPAHAAVFFGTGWTSTPLPGAALRQIYGLTPAEIRICESLMAGHPPAEIARRLGVAVSTVRTHLLRIFEKTGAKGQADLARMIAQLSALPTP